MRAESQIYDAREKAIQALMNASVKADDTGPLVEPGYEGPLAVANAGMKSLILTIGDHKSTAPSWSADQPFASVDIPRKQSRASARRNSNGVEFSLQRNQPTEIQLESLSDVVRWMHRGVVYRSPPVPPSTQEIVAPDGGTYKVPRSTSAPPVEETMSLSIMFGTSSLETIFERVDAVIAELGLGIEPGEADDRDQEGF
jgi:hypothetical protein